jgi:hypothetical protein
MDYDFLGKRPAKAWWSTVYGRFSAFEDFTLLLEATALGQWRAYLGGIPSGRRDRVGTPIRYTLAGEGTLGDDDARFFYKLLYMFLHDYNRSALESSLAMLGKDKLDSCFPQDFMDGLGKDWYSPETYTESLTRLYTIADAFAYTSFKASPFDRPQGAYMMRNDTAQQLLGLAGVLLNTDPPSKPLSLAVLNLSPDQEEIRSFWQKEPEGASALLFMVDGLKPADPGTALLFTPEGSRKSPQGTGFPLKLVLGILLILILGIFVGVGV